MATQPYTVTATPTDLAAALSLSADTRYYVENVGDAPVKIAILPTAPAASFRAHELEGHADNTFSYTGSERPYVWLRDTEGDGTTIVVTEAV